VYKWGLFLCLGLIFRSAVAQIEITKPNPVLYYNTKYLTLEKPILRNPDTSYREFHRYNIIENQDLPYNNLGNFGTAYYSLMFSNVNPIGYKHGFNSFDIYYNKPEKIKYYRTKTPYTFLDFIFGGKEEIIGGGEFSYNIKPNYNFAFNFHRNNFKGKSAHQLAAHNLLTFQQWFVSRNNFYDLKFNFSFNGIKVEENGGWAVDDAYTNSLYKKHKDIVPVFMEDAYNKWNEKNINFVQQFNLGNKEEITINDSTKRKIIKPKYTIEHDFEFSHNKFLYKDYEDDSAYYENWYYNSDSTTDLTKSYTVSNGIYFKNYQNDTQPRKFLYEAGLQYAFNHYQHMNAVQNFSDIQLKARLYSLNDSAFFNYSVSASACVLPPYIGDFEVNFSGKINLNKKHVLALSGNISTAEPTQKQAFYLGNHVRYNHDFKKVFQVKIQADYAWEKQLLFASIQNYFIQNYIYFDTSSITQQYHQPLNVLIAKIRKDFNTKHIYTGTEIYAQWISNRNLVRLPVFYIKQTVYYKGGFISGKLNAQLGFDITYNTLFKGNAYNPSLAIFYQQDKTTLKFYPVLDLFFNLHVKRTNIFLRMLHVNQGMFKQKGLYTAPNYGYFDRTFRVGVTWQFYD